MRAKDPSEAFFALIDTLTEYMEQLYSCDLAAEDAAIIDGWIEHVEGLPTTAADEVDAFMLGGCHSMLPIARRLRASLLDWNRSYRFVFAHATELQQRNAALFRMVNRVTVPRALALLNDRDPLGYGRHLLWAFAHALVNHPGIIDRYIADLYEGTRRIVCENEASRAEALDPTYTSSAKMMARAEVYRRIDSPLKMFLLHTGAHLQARHDEQARSAAVASAQALLHALYPSENRRARRGAPRCRRLPPRARP